MIAFRSVCTHLLKQQRTVEVPLRVLSVNWVLGVLQFPELGGLFCLRSFLGSQNMALLRVSITQKAFLDRTLWLEVATALPSLMLQVICKVGEKSLWQMYTEVPDILQCFAKNH